jgi:hypothetical protein
MAGQKTISSTSPETLTKSIFDYVKRLITDNKTSGGQIFERELTGTLLNTFTRTAYFRGIHYDLTDHTFWGVTPNNDTITNFHFAGGAIVINSSAPMPSYLYGFDGCCVDYRDGSLWLPGDKAAVETLNHVTRAIDGSNHHNIIHSFSTTSFIGVGKDICYDTSDNTLWILDATNKKIVHVSMETGLELAGTLNLVALGYPSGVSYSCIEYNFIDNSFYFGNTDGIVYHTTKSGIEKEHFTLPSDPGSLNGLTLSPLIQ